MDFEEIGQKQKLLKCGAGENCLAFHGKNTVYKWFNINRIGPRKRVNGKSGKAETTIFWPHYSGKCRTVGTYSPRRNHGRVTASKQTEKTVDTRHWRMDWLQIRSAKGDVTRSSTMEKKDIGLVVCCRQPSSRKVDYSEWVSEMLLVYNQRRICCHPLKGTARVLHIVFPAHPRMAGLYLAETLF